MSKSSTGMGWQSWTPRRIRSLADGAKFAILQACVSHIPPGTHAVVAGSPDDEGNSVEVVRALAGRLRVYWLVSDDPASLEWLISDADNAGRVTCVRKDTIRAHWLYTTARYVFFTHGLYGSPQAPRTKTFVNLWHGDGPKRRKGFAVVRSTFVVSGTLLWGNMRARNFGLDERAVLITGNPRVDQFGRPATDEALLSLGIDPSMPLVMWLPTYRKTNYRGHRLGSARDWSDTEELSTSMPVRSMLVMLAEEARTAGVTLIVKPHPLDADEFSDTGLRVVTSAELRQAYVALYQLLARAHGLITDYSSAWTDFLVRDKPVGFYCPDLDEYIVNRGLNVNDYPALLPGPMLENLEDFQAFLRDCLDEPESSKARRAGSIARIGLEARPGAANRLLDALGIPGGHGLPPGAQSGLGPQRIRPGDPLSSTPRNPGIDGRSVFTRRR